jgi:hypothetical protein
MVTNAQAALRWLDARPPNLEETRQAVARIVNDGIRAGDVVDRIRALIKKVPARTDQFDINDAIMDVVTLTRSELSSMAFRCGPSSRRAYRGFKAIASNYNK